jgi:hypothetical protein
MAKPNPKNPDLSVADIDLTSALTQIGAEIDNQQRQSANTERSRSEQPVPATEHWPA